MTAIPLKVHLGPLCGLIVRVHLHVGYFFGKCSAQNSRGILGNRRKLLQNAWLPQLRRASSEDIASRQAITIKSCAERQLQVVGKRRCPRSVLPDLPKDNDFEIQPRRSRRVRAGIVFSEDANWNRMPNRRLREPRTYDSGSSRILSTTRHHEFRCPSHPLQGLP